MAYSRVFDEYLRSSIPSDKLLAEISKTYNLTDYVPEAKKTSIFHNLSKCGESHFPFDFDINHAHVNIRDSLRKLCKLKNTKSNRFSIDGTACCGKSTLVRKLSSVTGFRSVKINQDLFMKDLYNVVPIVSLQYLTGQLDATKMPFTLADRSAVSNIAFQYVYYLLSDTDEKSSSISTYAKCLLYTEMHSLWPVLKAIKGANLNTLIIIDNNIEAVSERMKYRGEITGSLGDLIKGQYRDYIKFQNAAFAFIASVCDINIVDLGPYYGEYDFSEIIEHLHSIVKDTIELDLEYTATGAAADQDDLPSTLSAGAAAMSYRRDILDLPDFADLFIASLAIQGR